jgi:hypothetical protein
MMFCGSSNAILPHIVVSSRRIHREVRGLYFRNVLQFFYIYISSGFIA